MIGCDYVQSPSAIFLAFDRYTFAITVKLYDDTLYIAEMMASVSFNLGIWGLENGVYLETPRSSLIEILFLSFLFSIHLRFGYQVQVHC